MEQLSLQHIEAVAGGRTFMPGNPEPVVRPSIPVPPFRPLLPQNP